MPTTKREQPHQEELLECGVADMSFIQASTSKAASLPKSNELIPTKMPAIARRENKPTTQEEQPQQEEASSCGVPDSKKIQAPTSEASSLPTNNKLNLTKMPAFASRDTKPTTKEEQPQQEKLLYCGVADSKIIQAPMSEASSWPKNNELIPTKMPAFANRDTKPTTQEEQPQQEKLLCCGAADIIIILALTFEAASLPKNNELIPTKMPAIASRVTRPTTQEEQPQQEKLLCCGVAYNKITQASTFEAATLPKNNELIPTKMPAFANRDTKPITQEEQLQQEKLLCCGVADNKIIQASTFEATSLPKNNELHYDQDARDCKLRYQADHKIRTTATRKAPVSRRGRHHNNLSFDVRSSNFAEE